MLPGVKSNFCMTDSNETHEWASSVHVVLSYCVLLSDDSFLARCWMQIDILITNCSLYCPTPSLSAHIVNKFKMRSNVITYSLGGMGCSAGVIAISLAKELLQVCLEQMHALTQCIPYCMGYASACQCQEGVTVIVSKGSTPPLKAGFCWSSEHGLQSRPQAPFQ